MLGSTDKGDPGAPRLAGLEEPVRMGFSERPCLERKKEEVEHDRGRRFDVSLLKHVTAHICADHTHTYTPYQEWQNYLGTPTFVNSDTEVVSS